MTPDDYSPYFSSKIDDFAAFELFKEGSSEKVYDYFHTSKLLEIIDTANSATPLITLRENIKKIDYIGQYQKGKKKPLNDLVDRIQIRIKEILAIPDVPVTAAVAAAAAPDFVKGLPPVDASLFIHIHGDAFAKGTQLEGSSFLTTIGYLKSFLEKTVHRFPTISTALKTLQSSQVVASKIDSIVKEVSHLRDERAQSYAMTQGAVQLKELLTQTLDKEGTVSIPGGWVGNPGHAVFFEIIKEADNKLTLRMYNTGSGLDKNDFEIVDNKMKHPCFQEFNHIDSKDLFSLGFIETLIELQKPNTNQKEIGPKDFYAFISLIKGQKKETDFVIEDLMSPQRSGTCAWKSLCAFMRRNLSHDEYKRFKYEIKLQSLVDFFTHYTDDIMSFGERGGIRFNYQKEHILLRESVEKFARTTLKLNAEGKKSIISKEELAWVNNWLASSTKTLQSIEKLYHETTLMEAPVLICDEVVPFAKENFKINIVRAEELTPPKDPPFKSELLADLSSLNFTKDNIAPILTKFLHLYNDSYLDGDCNKELIYSIQNLLLKIPNPAEDTQFYTSFSKQESLELMHTLSEINDVLFKATFSQDESNWGREKSSLASFKVWAIMPILMQQADPQLDQILSSVKLETSKFNLDRGFASIVFSTNEIRNLFFQFNDPALDNEFMKISDLLKKREEIYSIYQLFNYGLSSNIEADIRSRPVHLRLEGMALLKLLEDPVYLTKINDIDPKFSTISGAEERIAYLMTHDNLLPESFKVLRQQTLIAKFFIRGNFVRPSSFQRTAESFKIQHDSDRFDKNSFITEIRDVEVLDNPDTKVQGASQLHCNWSYETKEKLKRTQFFHDHLCREIRDTELKNLLINIPSSEEELLTLNLDEHKFLPREKILGLLAPIVEKKFQAVLTLSYFDQNINLLNDADYQTLFQLFMFEGDALLLELKSNPDFVKTLETFVEKGYAHAIEYGKVEAALFFLNLSRHFKAYQEYVTKVPYKGFLDEKKALELISSKFSLDETELLAFHLEMAAHFIHEETIDEKGVIDLLRAKIFINKSSHDNSVADPKIVLEADQALYKFSSNLKEVLKENPTKILNQVLENLQVGEKKEWKEIEFPFFESVDGAYKINVITGMLSFKGALSVALPEHVLNDESFKYLFQDKVKFASFIKEGSYAFQDGEGANFRVLIDAKVGLVIQKEIEGKWFQFVPKNKLREEYILKINFIGNQALVSFYDHWISMDAPTKILIINPKAKQVEYIAEISGTKVTSVHTAYDPDEKLCDLNSTDLLVGPGSLQYRTEKLCSYINNFELIKYVNMWKKNDQLTKIELPRFSLNLIADYSLGTLVLNCKEFKGFHLAKKQYIESLGTFNHFLLLENDQGEKKVLIPKRRIEATDTQGGILAGKVALQDDFNSEDSCEFASYKVTPKGTLKPETLKDAFYLSLISLVKLDYETSYSLLEEKNRLYTPEERELLLHIVRCDNSLNKASNCFTGALAIRLRAAYLLSQNDDHFGGKENGLKVEEFASDLTEYINQLNNVSIPALTIAEQIYLCKKATEDSGDIIFNQRLVQLDSQYLPLPTKLKIDTRDTEEAISKNMIDDAFHRLNLQTQIEPIFRLRPGSGFTAHFSTFYNHAKGLEGDDKRDVEERLPFLMIDDSLKVYGTILEYALKYPERCPDVEALLHKENFIKLVNEAIESKAIEKKAVMIKIHPPERQKVSSPTFLPLTTETESIQKDDRGIALIAQYFVPEEVYKTERASSQDLLKSLATATASSDKIYVQEMKKLEQDCIGAQKIALSAPPALKLIRALADLGTTLQGYYKVDYAKGVEALGKCLEIANRKPTDQDLLTLHEMKMHGKVLRPITEEDLTLFLVRQDINFLKEINPLLTDEEVISIGHGMKEYFIHMTNAQKWLRAQKIEQELEKATDSTQYQELTQELAERIKAERHYDPDVHPQYLAFEYFADILMRQAQVETLEKFLIGQDNTILQMIMGGGKTKVLLPILGFMRANGSNLSMIVVPESLYEQTAEDMRITSKGAFSQGVHALNFDRNTKFTPQKLSEILRELEHIQASRLCLVMTNKSVLCLYLKYLEACHSYSRESSPELEEKITLMGNILSLLKEKAQVIIDEADLTLNCRHEVNFTFGSPEGLKPSRADTVGELYQILLESEEIRKKIQLDFAPEKEELAQPFTLDLYENEIKPILVDKWLTRHPEFATYREYLLGKVEITPTKNQDANDLLALIKEEINTLLPLTLKKNYAEHYGISDNTMERLAVPYLASNTPSKGSQFGNTYELMNYTLQMYIKNGIKLSSVYEAIYQLQNQALLEIKSGIKLEETESFKAFQLLVGPESKFHLFRMNKPELVDLQAQINGSLSEKINFVKRYILSRIKVFDHKLSGNAQNLVTLFAQVQGFTGTLWNEQSFHSALKPVSELGTDAKTLSILWENSKDKVHISHSTSSLQMLNEIFDKSELKDIQAIIDTGGSFKGFTNEEVARVLLEKTSARGVVFYNTENVLVILEKGDKAPKLLHESELSEKERITFYDQRHTTGSDIAQAPFAKAVVTIGKATFLRDLLQSVWRMRRLDKGQRVEFLIPNEIHKLICIARGKNVNSLIDFEDIMHFCIQNQAKQIGEDNIVSLKQKMKECLQEIMVKHVLPQDLFKVAERLFLQDTSDSPFESFGKPQEIISGTEAAERELVKSIREFENLVTLYPAINSERDVTIKKLQSLVVEESLPSFALSPGTSNYEQSVEVEQEQEQEKELEQEKEIETVPTGQKIKHIYTWALNRLDDLQVFLTEKNLDPHPLRETISTFIEGYDVPSFSVNEGLAMHPEFAKYQDVFSKNLLATGNLLLVNEFKATTSPVKPFDYYQKKAHLFAVIFDKEKQSFKIMLADQKEAASLRETVKRQVTSTLRQPESLPPLEFTAEAPLDLSNPQVKRFLVLAGVFDGKHNYSSSELEFLNTVIKQEEATFREGITEEMTSRGLYEVWIYQPELNVTLQSTTQTPLDLNHPELQRLLVEAKFFNGELNYSTSELEILRAFIQEKGVLLMEELFVNNIIKNHEVSRSAYENTAIKRLFDKLKS